jgi:hypothetical protein
MKLNLSDRIGCAIKFPIHSGFGNSLDNAVLIDEQITDYIKIQNNYITCILGQNWKKLTQSLIVQNDKLIDKIYVEYYANEEIVIYLNFYFDVTDCI